MRRRDDALVAPHRRAGHRAAERDGGAARVRGQRLGSLRDADQRRQGAAARVHRDAMHRRRLVPGEVLRNGGGVVRGSRSVGTSRATATAARTSFSTRLGERPKRVSAADPAAVTTSRHSRSPGLKKKRSSGTRRGARPILARASRGRRRRGHRRAPRRSCDARLGSRGLRRGTSTPNKPTLETISASADCQCRSGLFISFMDVEVLIAYT